MKTRYAIQTDLRYRSPRYYPMYKKWYYLNWVNFYFESDMNGHSDEIYFDDRDDALEFISKQNGEVKKQRFSIEEIKQF